MWLSLGLSLLTAVVVWFGGFFADSEVRRRRLLAYALAAIGIALTSVHEFLDATADDAASTAAAESDAKLNREIAELNRQLTERADSDTRLNREITETTRQLAEQTRLAAESDAALNREIAQLLTANGELNKELSERARASSESDAALNRRIANLTTQNAELNREMVDYTRGTGSYFYIHFQDYGTDRARALVQHEGEHPVWHSMTEVFDVTDQFVNGAAPPTISLLNSPVYMVSLPAVFDHGVRKFNGFPIAKDETRTAVVYLAIIYAQSGEFQQLIRLNKVGNDWQQRYVVARIEGEGRTETFIKRFP